MDITIRKVPRSENKLLKIKPGMVFWSDDLTEMRDFIVAEINNEVIGFITYVEISAYDPNCLGVIVISVHLDFQGRGIAKRLINEVFNQAWLLGQDIRVSPFSPEGDLKVKHIFYEISESSGIKFRYNTNPSWKEHYVGYKRLQDFY